MRRRGEGDTGNELYQGKGASDAEGNGCALFHLQIQSAFLSGEPLTAAKPPCSSKTFSFGRLLFRSNTVRVYSFKAGSTSLAVNKNLSRVDTTEQNYLGIGITSGAGWLLGVLKDWWQSAALCAECFATSGSRVGLRHRECAGVNKNLQAARPQ